MSTFCMHDIATLHIASTFSHKFIINWSMHADPVTYCMRSFPTLNNKMHNVYPKTI